VRGREARNGGGRDRLEGGVERTEGRDYGGVTREILKRSVKKEL
jgi:hypothetical protein